MNNKLRKLLIIDNNDSFTYNIVDVLRSIENVSFDVVIHKNLKTEQLQLYDYFIISPGPGKPSDFEFMGDIIEFCQNNKKPLLGVCLGHQAICEYYGAKLVQLPEVVHGKQLLIDVDNSISIYKNLAATIQVGLYHSWIIDRDTFPNELIISGLTEIGRVMSIKHRNYEIYGVQYHPESFMTENGKQIIENFLNIESA